MYIGKVQELTGASPKAIRLYEELGLLGRVERRGTYRTYTDEHVQLIRLVRSAQKTGMRLNDMLAVLRETSDDRSPWESILTLIEQHQQRLAKEVQVRQQQQALLSDYQSKIAACLAASPDCKLTDEALDSAP